MKRSLTIVLMCCAFALTLGLAACGSSSSSSAASSEASGSASASSEAVEASGSASASSEAAEASSAASASSEAVEATSAEASESTEAVEEEFFYSNMTREELQFAVESQDLGEVAWAHEVWIDNSGDAAPSFQWQVVTADDKVYFIGNSGVAKEATDLKGVNKLTEEKAIELVEAQKEGKLLTADLSQDKEDGAFYWLVYLQEEGEVGAISLYSVNPEGTVTGPITN